MTVFLNETIYYKDKKLKLCKMVHPVDMTPKECYFGRNWIDCSKTGYCCGDLFCGVRVFKEI